MKATLQDGNHLDCSDGRQTMSPISWKESTKATNYVSTDAQARRNKRYDETPADLVGGWP
jgi:hypothetical protein